MAHSENKVKRVVVVTGSTQGIGKAIALNLIQQGNTVIFTDINKEILYKAKKETAKLERDCSFYILYVSNPTEVKKTVSLILQKNKKINILVNSAGIAAFRKIEDVTDECLDRMLEVN